MTLKNKSNKARLWSIVLTVLVLALYFAYEFNTANTLPPPTTPTPQVQSITTTDTPSADNSSKKFQYELYFTVPVRPFKGETGDGIETHLIEKINSAKISVSGAFFEFDLESVAQALINAHNRGVNVQIVYDNEYSDTDPQIKELIKAGIKAIPDNRSAYMHDKFVVFDNECVWTGSFNITVNAAYKNNENAFYICSSQLAENYTVEFSELFNGQFGSSSPANTPNPVIVINGVEIQNYFAPEDNVMDKILVMVSKAQTSIHFLSYSFTDDSLAQTMLDRLNNGVDLSGIFETRGANTESSECQKLLENGAKIYLDGNPYTLHDKIIIIDGKIVIFGSFNFTASANKSNDENLLIISDEELAKKFESEYQLRLAESVAPLGKTCKTP